MPRSTILAMILLVCACARASNGPNAPATERAPEVEQPNVRIEVAAPTDAADTNTRVPLPPVTELWRVPGDGMPCMLGCEMGYELVASPGPSNWPPFDRRALTNALAGIAVGHCAGDGGGPQGDVWIDLLPDGKVGGLTSDRLTPDTKDVRHCLGVAFGHVAVPPFRGNLPP